VVERRRRQRDQRVPLRVRGHRGVGVGRHEPEERGGDPPGVRHAVGPAEHPELLDVGDLTQVDLLGELAAHRALDVLVVAEQPAGQRPPSRVRWPGPLPGQDLQ
jgi:hypothetical protein